MWDVETPMISLLIKSQGSEICSLLEKMQYNKINSFLGCLLLSQVS